MGLFSMCGVGRQFAEVFAACEVAGDVLVCVGKRSAANYVICIKSVCVVLCGCLVAYSTE